MKHRGLRVVRGGRLNGAAPERLGRHFDKHETVSPRTAAVLARLGGTVPPAGLWQQIAGMTAEKLDALLARQMSDADKRARAHFIVDSSRSFESARAQVHAILRAVLALPGRRIG